MYLDLNNAPIVPVTSIPDRGEYERYHVLPDIRWIGHSREIIHDNFRTTIHHYMNKVYGFFERVEFATADSATYQLWLIGYKTPHDIPPHIQFGGAVKAIRGGDPTFHARWVEYVKRELLNP